jgi:thiosulfate reductase cytochrome b subunit
MALHFFMWLFVANGVTYIVYRVLLSGEWRKVLPGRHSLRDALLVALRDLHLRKDAAPQGLYNGPSELPIRA